MGSEPMRWHASTVLDKRWHLGRFRLRIHWRRSDGLMGRFGGGWNWRLGVQVGGTTVLFALVVLTVSIAYREEGW